MKKVIINKPKADSIYLEDVSLLNQILTFNSNSGSWGIIFEKGNGCPKYRIKWTDGSECMSEYDSIKELMIDMPSVDYYVL